MNRSFDTGGYFITLGSTTTYARGEASENFVFKIVDGGAQLAGYHVNSDALIVS